MHFLSVYYEKTQDGTRMLWFKTKWLLSVLPWLLLLHFFP